jgi:hypothetical protein
LIEHRSSMSRHKDKINTALGVMLDSKRIEYYKSKQIKDGEND